VAIEGLSAKIYLDHNADPRLVRDLRRQDYDAVFARELGRERASDEDHLRWAADHQRVLFTHDFDDYPVLAAEWAARGDHHAGIILALEPPRLPYAAILRRLLSLLDQLSADEFVDRVEWLSDRWEPPN
jgi:hypothetical protein